jgi:hypothetical protein
MTVRTNACPRCGDLHQHLYAVSRWDNKTYICDDCGMAEAMLQMSHGVDALDPILGQWVWVDFRPEARSRAREE